MSREIKFRAWNGEQMVSPDYISRDGIANWYENSCPTSCNVVMQYTGLKDKNGVEIYEGDIVKSNPDGTIDRYCEVIFPYHLKIIKKYFPKMVNTGVSYCVWDLSDKDEVIGNIYEELNGNTTATS